MTATRHALSVFLFSFSCSRKKEKKRHNSCVISALETRSPALFLFLAKDPSSGRRSCFCKAKELENKRPLAFSESRLMRSACRKLKPKVFYSKKKGTAGR